MILIKLKIVIAFICLLFFSDACTQPKERNTRPPFFDSSKTDLATYRSTFLNNLTSPSGFVNDYENIFSESEEKILDSLIAAFQGATAIEITVLTLDSTATARDNFDDLTLQIGNKWGLGKNNGNNAILVGISKGHRRIRIHNGYGIEKIFSDEETKKVIDDFIIPEFKNANFYQGTLNGLHEIVRALKQKIKK